MTSIQGTALTADGIELSTRFWPAATQAADPWATVLLVHGLGEHSGRYEHVGERMAAAGIEVHAYDHRGNGGSGGRRGHVERWSQFHDDLEAQVVAVRTPGRPLVLYGHSMGGLIVAGYCLTDRARPDLVVLSSPGLDSTLPAWKLRLAPILAMVVPTLAVANAIDGSTLSRDPSVAAKTRDDPLCTTKSTTRLAAESVVEQRRVRELAAGGLGVPTLVMHGSDDGLVPPSASLPFAGAPMTTRVVYDGLRHELHNEPEGLAIVTDVIAWLQARATSSAAATVAAAATNRQAG